MRTRLILLLGLVTLSAPAVLVTSSSLGDAVAVEPVAAVAPAAPAAAAKPKKKVRNIAIFVLSGRSDLVTGGDARVVIRPAKGLRRPRVKVTLNGRNVSGRFALRRGGRYEAYLTGLKQGRNVVVATATIKGQRFRGRLVITNYDQGGPVFSGPHTEHYRCQEGALDELCNQPATGEFFYVSSNPLTTGLQPYDLSNPPDDVAMTTAQNGTRIPFIVLREDGYQDRDRYTILTLWQPGKPWTRWKQQKQFNHKILITHGGGCGASYGPGSPPFADFSGTFPEETPGLTPTYITALGLGFSVISTALDNTGHNCNVAMNAESLMMAKEHFVEQYGTIRYTIGTGCSGGSIAQHTVANAYPGIYQGLTTTCSYPDTFTAGAQFADYHLLRLYFEDPSKWGPGVVWLPTQMAAVEGHLTHLNAIVADEGLFKSALNPEHDCGGTVAPVAGDPSTRYDSEINPVGVRCSVLDLVKNLLGPRPEEAWTPQEQAAGTGFGGIPFANRGIQYGLEQLKNGTITTEQFLDLNAKIGGLNIDSDPIPERIVGDPGAIANAYRTGMVNEANNLDQVAIINFGGPDPGIAHDYAHAFWTEDRLKRAQGHTDNRVMWFGLVPLIGNLTWAEESFLKMDRWLARVEKDHSKIPLSRKIVKNKPANVKDRCFNIPGILEVPGADDEVDCVLPEELQLRLSTPREQAGSNRFNDQLACQLRPLDRSDYDFLLLPLTDAQWQRMQEMYPDGVCDWDKLGQGQQLGKTWLTYFDKAGDGVVYGGRELPKVKGRDGDGWASKSFRSLLRQ